MTSPTVAHAAISFPLGYGLDCVAAEVSPDAAKASVAEPVNDEEEDTMMDRTKTMAYEMHRRRQKLPNKIPA